MTIKLKIYDEEMRCTFDEHYEGIYRAAADLATTVMERWVGELKGTWSEHRISMYAMFKIAIDYYFFLNNHQINNFHRNILKRCSQSPSGLSEEEVSLREDIIASIESRYKKMTTAELKALDKHIEKNNNKRDNE